MNFFDDSAYVIQFDRRGNTDFITTTNGYVVVTEAFKKDMLSIAADYGYDSATGTVTDVGTLRARGLKVASCNFSCGYYEAHSDSEYINIFDLFLATKIICEFTVVAQDDYKFPTVVHTPTLQTTYAASSEYRPYVKLSGKQFTAASSIACLLPYVTYGIRNGGTVAERNKLKTHSIIAANKIFLEGMFYASGEPGEYNPLLVCPTCRTHTIMETLHGRECFECGMESNYAPTKYSAPAVQADLFDRASDDLLGG